MTARPRHEAFLEHARASAARRRDEEVLRRSVLARESRDLLGLGAAVLEAVTRDARSGADPGAGAVLSAFALDGLSSDPDFERTPFPDLPAPDLPLVGEDGQEPLGLAAARTGEGVAVCARVGLLVSRPLPDRTFTVRPRLVFGLEMGNRAHELDWVGGSMEDCLQSLLARVWLRETFLSTPSGGRARQRAAELLAGGPPSRGVLARLVAAHRAEVGPHADPWETTRAVEVVSGGLAETPWPVLGDALMLADGTACLSVSGGHRVTLRAGQPLAPGGISPVRACVDGECRTWARGDRVGLDEVVMGLLSAAAAAGEVPVRSGWRRA